MINSVDKNVNVFHKGWQKNPTGSNPETGFEDPTYLGFRLIFFPSSVPNYENRENDNCLFTSKEEQTEGAEKYLESIGMNSRAAMIKRFKETMLSLTKRTPWYIQSVEGVSALWKIDKTEDGFDPYRAKEIILTFNCLESIDLRMTAVADLYRKATFDAKYMREILPENLREFKCELQIAEFRKFHTIAKKVNALSTAQNAINSNLTSVIPKTKKDENLELLEDYISIISFELRDCQFDFEDSFSEDVFTLAGDYTAAKQKFKIKVGKVYKERNQYTLLETILIDDYNNSSSSIIKGEVKTDDLSLDNKKSQFLPHQKTDLERRLERGLQTFENRGRDELNRLKQGAKDSINNVLFNNKIADTIRGFVDSVRAGDLGNTFEKPVNEYPGVTGETFDGNPDIKYDGVSGSTFEGNPPVEYPGTSGAVFDPGQPEYPGTSGVVFDPGKPEYPGTEGKVFDPKKPTYPGVKDKTFENPEITYPGVKDKTFENPEITYSKEDQGEVFENPEIKYSKVEEKSFEGNPKIEYKGVNEKTFENPDPEYPGVQEKIYEGNPAIKYENPDGKIFEGGNETVLPKSLEKVFDLSQLTPDQIRKLEKIFSKEEKEKPTESLGDVFENVPGKDLGVPERKYEKPQGNILGKEEKKDNPKQNLGTTFQKRDKTEE